MTTEQLGPFTLVLPDGCFPLGEGSLALGGFATVRPGWRACDLGCGGGTLLLLLAARERSLALAGVELDPDAAQAARENLARGGLTGEIVTGDLRQKGLLPNEGFELAVSNPPWFALGSGTTAGAARSEEALTLPGLCAAANRLLKTGGRFALVYPPARLTDLLCTLRAHKLEPKRLQLLAHDHDAPPSAALVEAVKNGRPGLEVLAARVRGGPPDAAGIWNKCFT